MSDWEIVLDGGTIKECSLSLKFLAFVRITKYAVISRGAETA